MGCSTSTYGCEGSEGVTRGHLSVSENLGHIHIFILKDNLFITATSVFWEPKGNSFGHIKL